MNQMIFYGGEGVFFGNDTRLHTANGKTFVIHPEFDNDFENDDYNNDYYNVTVLREAQEGKIVMDEMFKEFEFNEKPEQMISSVNGLELPEDYLAFMREHNGGEGPLGENNYGRFYRLEELQEINDEYEVQKWWPGCIVIGCADDQLWAYNPEKGVYCQIDSYNTDEDTYYTVSNSFEAFLLNMDEELA